MATIGFVFSGQGSQKAGMGQSFYEASDLAKRIFEEAEALRPNTIKQCFEGTAEELKQTDITQPCLYITDLVAGLVLQEQLQEKGITPKAVAGFSLGEIPALAFASAYSHMDGFQIACKRGAYMAEAAKETDSTMVAVLKLDNETIEQICKQFEAVYPVNYNAPQQLVVAGLISSMEEFQKAIREAKGRCMPIAVGGGFHSPFMDDVVPKMEEVLKTISIKAPEIPVYSNYKTVPYEAEYMIEWLTKQINHALRFQESIEHMVADGIDTFIEVGCGNTLTKLIKRIAPESQVFQFSTMEDWNAIESALFK